MIQIARIVSIMKNKSDQEMPCPCGTGNAYHVCCKPYHQGQLPESALKLMRSRYSAYAIGLPAYIISTTHPESPHLCTDTTQWFQKIFEFCSNTEFNKLEILDFQEKEQVATVTFFAHLFQNKKDVSFTERSYFEKINGKWFYHSGQFI